MFRRTFQVRLVKEAPKKPQDPETAKQTTFDPEVAAKVIQDTVVFCAVTYVSVRAAVTLLDTFRDVAIITAQAKLK